MLWSGGGLNEQFFPPEISGEVIECLDEDTPFRIQSPLESAAEEVIGSRVDRMMGISQSKRARCKRNRNFTPEK